MVLMLHDWSITSRALGALKLDSITRRLCGSQPLLIWPLMPPETSGTLAHTSEFSFFPLCCKSQNRPSCEAAAWSVLQILKHRIFLQSCDSLQCCMQV